MKFYAEVTEYIPSKIIVWQLRKGLALPAWIKLGFEDQSQGVTVSHILSIGFQGVGKIFDPLLKLFFPNAFEDQLAEHVHTEFKLLTGEILGIE